MRMLLAFLFLFINLPISAQELGEVNVLVFRDGLPATGQEVVIDGKKPVKTDQDGFLVKELEEGNHFLEVMDNGKLKSISFKVAEKDTTEVILNLFSNSIDLKSNISEPLKPIKRDRSKLGFLTLNLKDVTAKNISKGVSEAKVFIQGETGKFESDNAGLVKAQLPVGKYVVSVVHDNYKTKVVREIEVRHNANTNQVVMLQPAGLELEEFVVIAPHVKGSMSALIEVRRKSTQVAEVMGAEQISKSGDSDAASSLRRVTGLTIVDGKFVYIRGLGERYSNVLLNGTSLPSPDPTRRVVQLDLFPSGILQSMVIQKSYSPEYSGNFGGGTVVLNTKDIPDEFTAKVSVGVGYNGANDQLSTYQGGKRDWLGMDDGTRELPASIVKATSNGNRIFQSSGNGDGGFSRAEMIQFSKDMPRNYKLSDEGNSLPPSMSISIGDLYKHKGKKFGFLFSGMYASSWDNDVINRTSYLAEGNIDRQRNIIQSDYNVRLSGMLNFGVDLGKWFKISSNTLLLRKTTDRVTEDTQSSPSDIDANIRTFGMEWQERQLFSQVIRGEHQFNKRKENNLKWSASYSQATREQPDTRTYQQDFQNGKYITSTDGKRNEKFYNSLTDVDQDYWVKMNLMPYKSKSFQFQSKIGGQFTTKKRSSVNQRFKYSNIKDDVARAVTGDDDILSKSIQDICTDAVIDAGGCLIQDVTGTNDRYEADQEVKAYFVDTEFLLNDIARLNLGVRYEDSLQQITTYSGVDRNRIESGLEMKDYLPAASLTFFLTNSLQLRGTYSETISRPDFKDLNPEDYFDDERDRLITGNPNLKGTIITNYDTRLEWYFGKNENISLSYFQKEFQNPIEEVAGSFDLSGVLRAAEGSYQLANVGTAVSTGYEIEARKNFGFITPALTNLSFGGNYSVINSEMTIFSNLSSQVTNQVRPLQGQSAYVVNANLDYDNKDTGTTATLLYNVFGERIDSIGLLPFGDVYEQPFKQVDFVFSQKFGKQNKIKLRAQNILDPEAVLMQDGRIRETYRKGRVGSISFTRTF
jgi:outer membrane receptor protein involved in Fe transport/nucleoside-triphosphatase THEP1